MTHLHVGLYSWLMCDVTHLNVGQTCAFPCRTCNTLQHTATHYHTLQHTATHCNTLQHTAMHCHTLPHTATHCHTLQHTAAHCNTLQHAANHCNTLQHTATHCNINTGHVRDMGVTDTNRDTTVVRRPFKIWGGLMLVGLIK